MVTTSRYGDLNDLVGRERDDTTSWEQISRVGNTAKDLEHNRNVRRVICSAIKCELQLSSILCG